MGETGECASGEGEAWLLDRLNMTACRWGFETDMVMEEEGREEAGGIVWGKNSWKLPRWLNFWQYLAKFLAMFWRLSFVFLYLYKQIELPRVCLFVVQIADLQIDGHVELLVLKFICTSVYLCN